VELTKNVWAELSALATAYRCHLECATEKPLVFAHSPYQAEPLLNDAASYTFSGENIFYLRETARADKYRNSIRVKMNMPIVLEKQEIWRYGDNPVLYTSDMQASFPFRGNTKREIENEGYEARYRIMDAAGKEYPVIYADCIDTLEEAGARLSFAGAGVGYADYDVTTHHDRARVTLEAAGNTDLYHASIYGRPIVYDLNRSSFQHDRNGITQHGTHALNVTNSYFSDDMVGGYRQYEDWAIRELAECSQFKNEIMIDTHRGVFHARVGATVNVQTQNKNYSGVVNALSFHYRKEKAFRAVVKIEGS
jgi:hypothetical protein